MSLTSDPNDPNLRETDPDTGLRRTYLVMDEAARTQYVRPVRQSYRHNRCGRITRMSLPLAETYATNPGFYGRTFCATCKDHFRVGPDGEFEWVDNDGLTIGEKVGT